MQLSIIVPRIKANAQPRPVPETARGRALYTTDWFLNGKPVLHHYDNPRLSLRDGLASYFVKQN